MDWLAAYGAIDHQPGSELFYFTHKARQALQRDLGARVLRRYDNCLDAYMVCVGGWADCHGWASVSAGGAALMGLGEMAGL